MNGLARCPRRRYGEEGETLVEVLVAVVIMGIGFAVVLGGISTSIISSVTQQKLTSADSVIRTAAEKVISDPYVPCATPDSYLLPAVTDGYTVTVAAVEYWDGSSAFAAAQPSTCQAPAGPQDAGLQEVTLTVSSTGGHAARGETLDVVKRESAPS